MIDSKCCSINDVWWQERSSTAAFVLSTSPSSECSLPPCLFLRCHLTPLLWGPEAHSSLHLSAMVLLPFWFLRDSEKSRRFRSGSLVSNRWGELILFFQTMKILTMKQRDCHGLTSQCLDFTVVKNGSVWMGPRSLWQTKEGRICSAGLNLWTFILI